MEDRVGRGRTYGWATDNGPGMGWYISALDELHERVYDQIADLTESELMFAAPESRITIGWLTAHLISGEVRWIQRHSGRTPPDWLDSSSLARIRPYGEEQPSYGTADELIAAGRRVWNEWSRPILASGIAPTDATEGGALTAVGEVLMHLVWHWSFHSGHIGLVRLQAGGEYEWTFAD